MVVRVKLEITMWIRIKGIRINLDNIIDYGATKASDDIYFASSANECLIVEIGDKQTVRQIINDIDNVITLRYAYDY